MAGALGTVAGITHGGGPDLVADAIGGGDDAVVGVEERQTRAGLADGGAVDHLQGAKGNGKRTNRTAVAARHERAEVGSA